jgi:benzoylformate decarboxylase
VLDEPNHYLRGLRGMVEAVTKWTFEVTRVDQIPRAVQRAAVLASAPPRGPAALMIPQDILNETAELRPLSGPHPVLNTAAPPDAAGLARIIELFRNSRRPLAIAGVEVSQQRAFDALIRFSETYRVLVVGEAVDRGPMLPAVSFPLEHPNYAGSFSIHDRDLLRRLESSDLIMIFGARTVYPRVVGEWVKSATIVQVDEDSWQLGKSHPVAVGLAASVEATLDALVAAEIHTEVDQDWLAPRRSAEMADRSAETFGPTELARALELDLPPDIFLVDDSQSFSGYLKRYLRCLQPGHLFGTLASHLGWGLPAALGVQAANPGQQVVALVSDASLALNPQSLWTAARYRLPVTVVVVNNGGFLSLRRELQTAGVPDDPEGLTYLGHGLDPVLIGRGFGVDAVGVSSADALRPFLQKIGEKPRLVDVHVSDEEALWNLGWVVPPAATL